jgi:hypothetical protein
VITLRPCPLSKCYYSEPILDYVNEDPHVETRGTVLEVSPDIYSIVIYNLSVTWRSEIQTKPVLSLRDSQMTLC